MIQLYIILFILCIIQVTGYQSTLNPVLQYDFIRKDCLNGLFHDSSGSNLLLGLQRNITATSCLMGNGIQLNPSLSHDDTPGIVSVGSLAPLLDVLQGDSFTIAMWLEPDYATQQDITHSILSFVYGNIVHKPTFTVTLSKERTDLDVSSSSTKSGTDSSGQDTNPVDLQLDLYASDGSRASLTAFSYDMNSSNVSSIRDGGMMYITLSLTFHTGTWHPGNVLISTASLNSTSTTSFDLYSTTTRYEDYGGVVGNSLHPSSAGGDGYLWLLSGQGVPYVGRLHQVAMYNKSLSIEDVSQNILVGLPNSIPIATNITVVVLEDGQRSHEEDSVMSPLPWSSIAEINLPVYDVDDRPAHPNYNHNDLMCAQIIDTPSRGRLYRTTNSSLLRVGDWVCKDDSYGVKYQPETNQHSIGKNHIFDSFSVLAKDSKGAISDVACVSIIVEAVNDQPTPAYGLSRQVVAGVVTFLQLSGTDVDDPLSVSGALIASLPPYGSLHEITEDGTVEKVAITCNSTHPYRLKNPFVVAYIYTGHESVPEWSNGTLIVGNDSFDFMVVDNEGALSLPTDYKIEVTPSLSAVGPLALSPSVTRENRTTPVLVYGVDASERHRSLALRISSLPFRGRLFSEGSSLPLSIGDVIPMTPSMNNILGLSSGESRVWEGTVLYEAAEYFFNHPSYSVYGIPLNFSTLYSPSESPYNSTFSGDSFEYSVVEVGINKVGNLSVIASSSAVPRLVDVWNMNNPTEVTVECEDSKSEWCLEVFPYSSPEDVVVLTGVEVFDADKGVDLVRVEVSAQNGYLTLNASAIGSVDFVSSDLCFAPSQPPCEGRGYDDSRMSFVAAPGNISKVLNGMTYRSLEPTHQDEIVIKVFDGAGSPCLVEVAHEASLHHHLARDYTQREGCFTTTTTVSVKVLGYRDTETVYESSYSDSAATLRIRAIVGVVGVLLLVLAWRKMYICCCRRAKNAQESGDNAVESNSMTSSRERSFGKFVVNFCFPVSSGHTAGVDANESVNNLDNA